MIPAVTLIGFAYWEYRAAVQQLTTVPLSLPEARLCVLLALLPILFIRTSGTRRDSVFYSMATECPAVTLKTMILRNVGSRRPIVITERIGSRRRGVLDSLNVDIRVYLNTFLLTGNSVVPVASALAAYACLIVFLIRGTPPEDPSSIVMVLGFGVVFFYSSIFVESGRNFNLLFSKVHTATFFRLTRLMLAPHWVLTGLLVAVIVVLLGLFGMTRLTPVLILMLMSYVAVLPLLSWSSAMTFLNRRLLSGLYNTALALGGLVLSVIAPVAYAVYAAVICMVMYRRGMLRYTAFTVNRIADWTFWQASR